MCIFFLILYIITYEWRHVEIVSERRKEIKNIPYVNCQKNLLQSFDGGGGGIYGGYALKGKVRKNLISKTYSELLKFKDCF